MLARLEGLMKGIEENPPAQLPEMVGPIPLAPFLSASADQPSYWTVKALTEFSPFSDCLDSALKSLNKPSLNKLNWPEHLLIKFEKDPLWAKTAVKLDFHEVKEFTPYTKYFIFFVWGYLPRQDDYIQAIQAEDGTLTIIQSNGGVSSFDDLDDLGTEISPEWLILKQLDE
jgi:hypothetical protein